MKPKIAAVPGTARLQPSAQMLLYVQCESREMNQECKEKPHPHWSRIWRSDSVR